MRKFNIFARSLVAALVVSFVSKAVLAATPIAVWDGDFSTLTKGDISLNVNGNTLSEDKSSITISGDYGVLIDSTISGRFNNFTAIVRSSGLVAGEKRRVLFTTNSDNPNKTGVYLPISGDENGQVGGIWQGGVWNTNPTRGAIPQNYDTLIYNHQQTNGTYCYALANGERTTLYSVVGLRSSGSVYNGFSIGGLRANTSDTFKSATDLNITSIAIFAGTLTEAEMKGYHFDSDYEAHNLSGDVKISELEEFITQGEFADDEVMLLRFGESSSIVFDKRFDTHGKQIMLRSNYDVELKMNADTTAEIIKSVIASDNVDMVFSRQIWDVSNGLTISDQNIKDSIRTSGLTYVFKGEGTHGLTLEYALNVGSQFASHLIFEGGTHVFKFGNSTGNGTTLFASGHSNDNPTIRVKNATTLNFTAKDLSGWSGVADASGVIRVDKGGKLNLLQNENGTCFYRQRLYLEPGSYMSYDFNKADNGEGRFRLQGGTGEATAQIYIPASEDEDSEPAVIEQLGEGQLILASDNTRGLAVFIGENSKLKLDAELQTLVNDAGLVKYGEGELILKRTFSPRSFNLVKGTLSVENDMPIELFNNGTMTISGDVTIDIPENRILSIKSNITTTDEAVLSKVGAGKLMITTARPKIAALEGVLQLVATEEEIARGGISIPTVMTGELSTANFIVRPVGAPALDLMDAKISDGVIYLSFAQGAGISVSDFAFDYKTGLTNLTMTAGIDIDANHSLVTGNKLTAQLTLTTANGHKVSSEMTSLSVVDGKVVVAFPIDFDGLQGELASYTLTIRDSSGNLVGSSTTTDIGAWKRGDKWIDEKPYQRWGTGDWDYENELVVSNGFVVVDGKVSFVPSQESSEFLKLAFSVDFGDPIAFETAEAKLADKKFGIMMISEGLENAYAVVTGAGKVSRVYPSTLDKKVDSEALHDIEIIIDKRSGRVAYLVDSTVLSSADGKSIFALPIESISEIDFDSFGLVKAVEGSELSDALAKVGEQEFHSVAEAVASSSDGKVTILWPSTWTPGAITAIGEDDDIGEKTIEFSGKPVIVPDSVVDRYWDAGMVLVKDSDTKYTITSKYLTISITEPKEGSTKPVYIESVKTNSTMVAWKYKYGTSDADTAHAKIIYGDNVTITFSNNLEDGANGALLFARKDAFDGSGNPIEEGLQIKEVVFMNVKSNTDVELKHIPTLGELEDKARAKVMALYDYGVAAAYAKPDTSLDIIDFTANADGVTFKVSALEGMSDAAKKAAVGKLVKFSTDLKNWTVISGEDSITINADGSITVKQIGSSGFYKVEIPEE